MPIGVGIAGVLLVAAITKPWSGFGLMQGAPSGSPATSGTVPAATAPALSVSPSPIAGLCTSPGGWLVVADDVEFGRTVRTWLVADAVFSAVPPDQSILPLTTLFSSGVESLGFCLPAALSEAAGAGWSGTLWRIGGAAASSAQWQQVGLVTPTPGSLGAEANSIGRLASSWPSGTYVLEARFEGVASQAWLGLVIEPAR